MRRKLKSFKRIGNILATVHQKASGNYVIEIKIRLIASKTLMNFVKFLRDRAEFE